MPVAVVIAQYIDLTLFQIPLLNSITAEFEFHGTFSSMLHNLEMSHRTFSTCCINDTELNPLNGCDRGRCQLQTADDQLMIANIKCSKR